MKKRLHCRPVTVPMTLPALAQFETPSPEDLPFDAPCEATGPVSSLHVQLCAIVYAIQLVMFYQRQIPFVKGHGTL